MTVPSRATLRAVDTDHRHVRQRGSGTVSDLHCNRLRCRHCALGNGTFPSLRPRIADAGLRERVTIDLDGELEGLIDQVGGARVGVLDIFGVLVPVQCVGAAMVHARESRHWIGFRDGPISAREELQANDVCGHLVIDQNPCAD